MADEGDDPAEHGMPFRLFCAPLRNVEGLLRDVDCNVCGQWQSYAFRLSSHDHLIRPCLRCGEAVGLKRGWLMRPADATACPHCGHANPWPADRPDPPIEIDAVPVCYACLRAGKVAIFHETESFFVEYPLAVRGLACLRDKEVARRLGLPTSVVETFDDGSQSLAIPLPKALLFELLCTPGHQNLQREYWPYHCDGVMAYVGRWEPEDFDRHAADGNGYAWFAKHLTAERAEEAEDMWSWLEAGGIAWSCVYRCETCGEHRVYVDAD
jgi:uncharacterized protein CbrC (UPF0167 family)